MSPLSLECDLEWLATAARRVLTPFQRTVFFLFVGPDADGFGSTVERIALHLGISVQGVKASLEASTLRLERQWRVRNSILDGAPPPDPPRSKNNVSIRKAILLELFRRRPEPIGFDRLMCVHGGTANHSGECAPVSDSAFVDLETSGHLYRNGRGWLLTTKGSRIPEQLNNNMLRRCVVVNAPRTILPKPKPKPEPQPDPKMWVGYRCECGFEVPTKHMGVCKTRESRVRWVRAYQFAHEGKHRRLNRKQSTGFVREVVVPELASALGGRDLFKAWAHLNDLPFPAHPRFDALREKLPNCRTRGEARTALIDEGFGRRGRLPEWLPRN